MLPEYEQRFHSARESYVRKRQQCHFAVKNWEWYTFHHFQLDPGYFLLDECMRPGRKLRRPPTNFDGKSRYGMNSAGDVVVAESHVQIQGQCYEEFWEYGRDRIDGTLFDYHTEKACLNVATRFANGGVDIAYILFGAAGFHAVTYQWQDGLIQKAHGCRPAFTREPGPPPLEFIEYQVKYRVQQPASVTKTVTWDDGSVSTTFISYDASGRKKAVLLEPEEASRSGSTGA